MVIRTRPPMQKRMVGQILSTRIIFFKFVSDLLRVAFLLFQWVLWVSDQFYEGLKVELFVLTKLKYRRNPHSLKIGELNFSPTISLFWKGWLFFAWISWRNGVKQRTASICDRFATFYELITLQRLNYPHASLSNSFKSTISCPI